MADIVYGLGTSHGPLLNLPPKEWEVRAAFDRAQTDLALRDGTYTFPELHKHRGGPHFGKLAELKEREQRHAKCQKALDELGVRLRAIDPDVLVIVGDDQHEWFMEDKQPSFAIFCGDEVLNSTPTPDERKEQIEKGRGSDMFAYRPERDQAYPSVKDLALHMHAQALEDEFDVAACLEQPKDPDGTVRGVGHAVGFIYRRLLQDKPIPVVPVLINTFYPPNQPTPKRCYELGRSLGKAIRSWKPKNGKPLRVGVVASGGISHFVVDEEWDHKMLKAFRENDVKTLTSEPNIMFRSGTSETKNWILAAGILDGSGFTMDLVDYVPCYRTDAGTGSGMAFATWS
jgi:hypothetical protein